jgi:hypothetical protein
MMHRIIYNLQNRLHTPFHCILMLYFNVIVALPAPRERSCNVARMSPPLIPCGYLVVLAALGSEVLLAVEGLLVRRQKSMGTEQKPTCPSQAPSCVRFAHRVSS